MSFGSNGTDISLVAAADQSAAQYKFGSVDSNGAFAIATAAGQSVIGALQNNPGSGQAATIRVGGVSKAIAGGAITAGALLKVDSQGRVVAASLAVTNTSDAGAASDPLIASDVIGVALASASGAGVIIAVLVEPRGAVATTAA